MIDVKAAVRVALDYTKEFSEFLPTYSVRLEETEFVDTGYWDITLSFQEEPFSASRVYKVFHIDAGTGEVRSMKVRELAR